MQKALFFKANYLHNRLFSGKIFLEMCAQHEFKICLLEEYPVWQLLLQAIFATALFLKIPKTRTPVLVEFQHVKPGKGAAFVRTKYRNLITGTVLETSFNPTAKFEQSMVDRRDMSYSYEDGDLYYFMDNETYDQVPVNKKDVGDNFKFCKEGDMCKILSYKGKIFGVEIPTFVELEVTETEPGFKGNTATNTLKPAKLETGAEIRVPMFINEGEKIRIDTRTGEYMERV